MGSPADYIASQPTTADRFKQHISPPPHERATMTVYELADYLGISRSAAYEALRRGDVPAKRIGTRWIIYKPVVDRWLAGSVNPWSKPA